MEKYKNWADDRLIVLGDIEYLRDVVKNFEYHDIKKDFFNGERYGFDVQKINELLDKYCADNVRCLNQIISYIIDVDNKYYEYGEGLDDTSGNIFGWLKRE